MSTQVARTEFVSVTMVHACPQSIMILVRQPALQNTDLYGKLAMRSDGVIRSHRCSPIVVPPLM